MSKCDDGRGRNGPRRVLNPFQEDAIRAAMAFGARARDLAAEYGVTTRTIYRTMAMRQRKGILVTVGDYRAVFVIDKYGPVQVTDWMAA